MKNVNLDTIRDNKIVESKFEENNVVNIIRTARLLQIRLEDELEVNEGTHFYGTIVQSFRMLLSSLYIPRCIYIS